MKRLGNLTAVLLVTLPLAGCTGGPQGPSVQDAADELATALSAGRLTSLAFSGGTPQQAQGLWTRAVDGLGDSKPRVEVGKVTEGADGKPSTASLSYVWRLAGNAQPWTYDTTAELTRGSDDAWQVRLDPSLVYPDLQKGESLRLTPVTADRADITGAGGSLLVTERPVLRFGIDKGNVPAASAGSAARRLARLVGIDPAAYAERVRDGRAEGVRRGDRAPARRRGQQARRGRPDPGGRGGRRHPAAGADPRVRAADPRRRSAR